MEKENEDITNVTKKPLPPPQPAKNMRQVIIETDGTSIRIVKADVAGNIELIGILQNLIDFINKK